MAKSPTEQIRELSERLAVLAERDDERGRAIDQLEARLDAAQRRQAEELERVEVRHAARLEQLETRLTAAEVEKAALKQQLQDHVSQYQEGDRRRWGLITLLVGAVMSLATGPVVSLAKK